MSSQDLCLSGLGVSSQPFDPSAVFSSSLEKSVDVCSLVVSQVSSWEFRSWVSDRSFSGAQGSSLSLRARLLSVTQTPPFSFQLLACGGVVWVAVHALGILLVATQRSTLRSLKVTLRILLAFTESGDSLAFIA